MKIRLSIPIIALALTLALTSCSKDTTDVDAQGAMSEAILGVTEDSGQGYIDSLIFVGESTTYHLKSRGVLSGGTETQQVWASKSGTLNLDMSTKNAKIIYPETGELMTISHAAERSQPEYIVFTFGLNGAVQNISKGEEYYKSCYLSLINSVRAVSPETRIILQSAFPVASNMDMTNYSVDVKTLNEYIDTINSWTLDLAISEGLRYLNTSEILKDGSGYLRYELQVGDGHHLKTEAYTEILEYIRTHEYK
ncbi:MAG: hypothetical protein E7679_06690 [Ruminococcaceae bacterium]|nr:hypothetical protein [Oscillospiraceae bacterium]